MSRAEFYRQVDEKLDRGSRDYGDRSFNRPPLELITELQAEALDLAGWGYILWERLERMKEALGASDYPHAQYSDGLYKGETLEVHERRAFDAGFALATKGRDAK